MIILNCNSWHLAFFSLVDTDTVVSTIIGLWGSHCPVFLSIYWTRRKTYNELYNIRVTVQSTRMKDLIQLWTKLRVIWHKKGKSCLWNKQYGKIRNLVRKEWWGRPSEQDFKNVECSFKSYLKECKLLLSIPEDWVFKDCFCWGSVEEMKYSSLSFLK